MSAPCCSRCGDEREVLYGGTYAPCPACRPHAAARLGGQRAWHRLPTAPAGGVNVEVLGEGEVHIYDPRARRVYAAPAHVALTILASGGSIPELLTRARAALGRETDVLAAYEAAP